MNREAYARALARLEDRVLAHLADRELIREDISAWIRAAEEDELLPLRDHFRHLLDQLDAVIPREAL